MTLVEAHAVLAECQSGFVHVSQFMEAIEAIQRAQAQRVPDINPDPQNEEE
jgi:hypothetical protein